MRAFTMAGMAAAMAFAGPWSRGQAITPEQPFTASPQQRRIATLGLPPALAQQLQASIEKRKYADAEALLLPLVNGAKPDATTALRLDYLGGIYYLAQDYLSTAVALKKSEAIAPLEPSLRFTLAMAYLRMNRPTWADNELATLSAFSPREALYPYWRGRLAYDAQHYQIAIGYFEQSIALDPKMARTYDNLGLCNFALNHNERAVELYYQAIMLDSSAARPSPWPYLNLGIALAVMSRTEEAERSLRHALELDPGFAQAHFELGNLLVNKEFLDAARDQFLAASKADPLYAEPHYALARLYRRLGESGKVQQQIDLYKQLHEVPSKQVHHGP